jgi:superfamily II DNA or RNA helicase
MMTQFQKELWSRFTIPLVRLDSIGINRVRTRIPSNANPFHFYDRAIISIDTLKQENEYRVHLENAHWDVIVIDEAHNVAARGSKSARAKLAELLASRSDALIMTSATPHDGKPASFASLMNMLNPTAIANPEKYVREDIKGLYVRRFKKDIREQIAGSFLERIVYKLAAPATLAEEHAYDVLAQSKFESFDRQGRSRTGQLLFRTVLEKALFSSPAACRKTIAERLKKLDHTVAGESDRSTLLDLDEALGQIQPADFSKYQLLVAALRPDGKLKWNSADPHDRLVLFTERIETLRFLYEHLKHDLSLKKDQIAILHGSSQDDIDLQEIVKEFGTATSPIRLLIASDIAAEGINLHFHSHKLVHFDIPWSLMTFQQRNGRVDRYGQEQQPIITYLTTTPTHDRIRGDLRNIELLIEKDTQAQKNIGDPSVFLGAYDDEQEELVTAQAIESGLTPEEFNRQLNKAATEDPLAFLFADTAQPTGKTVRARKRAMQSLFPDDLTYFDEALVQLDPKRDLQTELDPERRMISLTVNEELKRVFRYMPSDVLPPDYRLHLTTDRVRVKASIKQSRESGAWPDVQLLWDLHPIVEWLNFKLLVSFGRHQAPVVPLPLALSAGETLFLMEGEIPNRKGQPVIHEWCAPRFVDKQLVGTLSLTDFLAKTQLGQRNWPNSGLNPNHIPLDQLRADAVGEARRWMSAKRQEFEARMRPRLDAELAKLKTLQERQTEFVQLTFFDRRKEEKIRGVNNTFEHYQAWIEDTMTTQDEPYLRIVAVFTGADF